MDIHVVTSLVLPSFLVSSFSVYKLEKLAHFLGVGVILIGNKFKEPKRLGQG